MVKKACGVLAVGAVAALALVPAMASAGTAAPADGAGSGVVAYSSTPPSGDPSTTVTFTVTTGALTMTAPATVDIGSGAPGTTIAGPLGTVTVTDNRALLSATWTAIASAGDWATGGKTTNETIPVGDVGYNPGSITTTGKITATGTPITLSGASQTIVTGTAGVGDNSASWNPTISVAVPASAVGGGDTGTLTESVS